MPQCLAAMARCSDRQLRLAFPGQMIPEANARVAARTRATQSPKAHVAVKVARTRTRPARDSRGRFVSFPPTDAPTWYVFCADGYRIPSEPLPEAIVPVVPAKRQPLPRAVARSRRPPRVRVTRVQLLTYLACVVGYIALLWYGLHLPRPHR